MLEPCMTILFASPCTSTPCANRGQMPSSDLYSLDRHIAFLTPDAHLDCLKQQITGQTPTHLADVKRSHYLPNLVQTLKRAQTERKSLRSTPYPHEASHRPALTLLLYAQVRKSILTYTIGQQLCLCTTFSSITDQKHSSHKGSRSKTDNPHSNSLLV